MTRESPELLDCVVLDPPGDHRASVVWLHGLGADGNDFAGIVPELGLPAGHGVRFVFPHAPVRPITINAGLPMRAWYDVVGLELSSRQDEAGIRASQAQAEALIARERALGIPSERIVLAGFSQGGAVAVFTGLRHAEPLAGIMALSTYALLPQTLEDERAAANRATPVFAAHGTLDPMVPYERGRELRELLRALGQPVEWHEYPMGHQVCLEEIRAAGAWLRQRLGGETSGADR